MPISNVDVGYEKALMPMIRPTDFYQHLADLGKLSILYAEQDTAVLTKCPRLVYSRSLQPSHKIPVYIYMYIYIYVNKKYIYIYIYILTHLFYAPFQYKLVGSIARGMSSWI